ncbi:hypothetical protein [Mycobacteroides abscessus]
MRLAKTTAAVFSALFLGGLVQGCQPSAKSDCDIAADMMDYRKKTGSEVDAVKDNSDNMEDPNGFILGKYDSWLAETQKDVDLIKDQNVKRPAQAVVDSDKEYIGIHRAMIVNPPNFDDLTWRAGFDSNMKAVFDRMDKATNDLKQVCPNVKTPSGS